MITKQELFPINILRVKFPNMELLQGVDEELSKFFAENDTLDATGVKPLIGNYESTLSLRTVDANRFNTLRPVRDWLTGIQNELWEALGFKKSLVAIDRSWVNRLTKSTSDTPTHLWPHVHGSTDMVCTFYYKYPPGSATIRFHNPAELQFGLTPHKQTSVAITPEEGELLCWPGYMWHSVDDHMLDSERIVLGFHINQQSFSLKPRWTTVVQP